MTVVTQEVRKRVTEKVADCIQRASDFYKDHTFKMPTINYDVRGTTAGKANHYNWTVMFNPSLLMDNIEDFIKRTVPHEVAHLVDHTVNPENYQSKVRKTNRGFRRTKRSVHGPDFKFIMTRVLGASDATRCHNYDVSKVAQRKSQYEYRCTCGCGTITSMGPKRHEKEQHYPGTYWLRGHGKAKLEFVGKPSSHTVKPAAPSHNVPSSPNAGKSNKDIARGIFHSVGGVRGDFIRGCEAAGIKKVTASTYHHNFKSGKWV